MFYTDRLGHTKSKTNRYWQDHPLDFASCKPKGKENKKMWKDKNIKRTPQIAHKIKLEILSKSAKLLLWLQVKKKKKKSD